MARHAKKQKQTIKTFLQNNKTLVYVFVAVMGVILLANRYEYRKQYHAFENQCYQISNQMNVDVCKKALKCSVNAVGMKTLVRYDRYELSGDENRYVTHQIAKCLRKATK